MLNVLKYMVIVLVLLQFIQVDITNPITPKNQEIKAPKPIMKMFKRACYDCHSNEVKIPWYANIAPISFYIKRHVDLGRAWLNFSIWETYDKKKKDKKLQEIYKAIYKAMPLADYISMHKEASLSKEQRDQIRKWTNKAPF